MKKVLWSILCVVLVVAMIGVGLFSSLMNFKVLDSAWNWIEDRFGGSEEGKSTSVATAASVGGNDYQEILDYYSTSIAEYVNTLTETKDFSMQYIDVLSGDGRFYYNLVGGAADITINLVDVDRDKIIDTFTFDCPLDDNLRKRQDYMYPISALSAMALSMLEENYPGRLTEGCVIDATSQIVAYFSGENLDSNYEYCFSVDDSFVMFDIMFIPSAEGSSSGMISMCLTT